MKHFSLAAAFFLILSCGGNGEKSEEIQKAQNIAIEKISAIENQTEALNKEIESIGTEVEEINTELDELLKEIEQ